MTLAKIKEIGLVNDDTDIYIRDSDMHLVAYGHYYEDNVLKYFKNEIEIFSWQNNNDFYIDLI